MVVTIPSQQAMEVLQIEEADCWFEYLEETRASQKPAIPKSSPWAWSKLKKRLRAISSRRKLLAQT